MSRAKAEKDRNKNDFYETPKDCIRNFFNNWLLFKNYGFILDPCAGSGVFSDVMCEYDMDYDCIEQIDIEPKDNNVEQRDFFELSNNESTYNYDLIISNPPYRKAIEFIKNSQKILSISGKIVFLLRLNFLGSQKRHDFFKNYMPEEIHVLSKRPSFTNGGTDGTEYAFFVWGKYGADFSKTYVI